VSVYGKKTASQFKSYLEVILLGFLAENINLFFRSIEFQQSVIYAFCKCFRPKIRSFVKSL